MKLLLDTHVAIWWLTQGARLSDLAEGHLQDETCEVLLSAIVAWEIAIKRSSGKLDAPRRLVGTFLDGGATPLPVTLPHAEAVEHLPLHHRDPFDRLLLAQATVEGASIVSADPSFRPYDVPIVW